MSGVEDLCMQNFPSSNLPTASTKVPAVSASAERADRADLDLASWQSFVEAPVDVADELRAVVAAIESFRLDPYSPAVSSAELVALHGAVFLFQLGGRAELLPAVGGLPFGRRLLERRIVAAARRLAGGHRSAHSAWAGSALRIEDLIGLIDPELRDAIAA